MLEKFKSKDEQILGMLNKRHTDLSKLAKDIAEELNKKGIGIKEAGTVFKDPDFAQKFIEQVGKKALEDVSKMFEIAKGEKIIEVNEIKIGFPEMQEDVAAVADNAAAIFSNKQIILNKWYYNALVNALFEDFQAGNDVSINVLKSLVHSYTNMHVVETIPDKILSKYRIGERLEDHIEALAIYVYTRLVHESVHAVQYSCGAKETKDNMIGMEGSASFVEVYFANALINNDKEKIAKEIKEDFESLSAKMEELASLWSWKSIFTMKVNGGFISGLVSPYELGMYVFAKIYQASGSFAETLKFIVSLLEKGEISDHDLYKEFEKLHAQQLSNAADIMPLQRK